VVNVEELAHDGAHFVDADIGNSQKRIATDAGTVFRQV
jgi:hypothetical protein